MNEQLFTHLYMGKCMKNSNNNQEDIRPRLAICTALPKELAACLAILDSTTPLNPDCPDDANQYWWGSLPSRAGGKPHQVLVTSLVKMGNNVAATAIANLIRSFPSVEYILMVGIAGGVPDPKKVESHVRLGDVVITNEKGILQYDNIKRDSIQIEVRDNSPKPSATLIAAAKALEAGKLLGQYPWQDHIALRDHLEDYHRPPSDTDVLRDASNQKKRIKHPIDPWRNKHPNSPKIHLAAIGSANTLLKDAIFRDQLRDKHGIRAIEMEGSGTANASWSAGREYIVIRGICDYCDEQKNNIWQNYAALVAAAYARSLIENLPYFPPRQRDDRNSFVAADGAGSSVERTVIVSSDLSDDIEQLLVDLGEVKAEKLESIRAMRGRGDIDEAWQALSAELATLANSRIPQEIQANYYYHAARWAQEDEKSPEEHRRYYQAACRLNPKLDNRTYRAFEAASENRFDDAIAILSPLNSEPVATNLLKYLLDAKRGAEADDFIKKLEIPLTDEIRRFQALCRLATGNIDGAWLALEPTLPKQQNNLFFQLTAAYIAFWQALPSGFHNLGDLPPHFFQAGIFSLEANQKRRMQDALNFLEHALTLATSSTKKEISRAVIDAYLAVCVNLPEKHNEAIEKAKSALAENPIAPSPVLCLIWLNVEYEWTLTLKAFSTACAKPYPPSWQIDLLMELLLHTNQAESAWQYLLQFEHRFSTPDEKTRWFERAVYSLDLLGRLSELEDRIEALGDDAAQRRIAAGYWIRRREIDKALSIAESLAKLPGTLLDHINLVSIHRQEQMWQELTVSAKDCLSKFPESPSRIAFCLAQAWLALNSPIEALKVLEKYQHVFERENKIDQYYACCLDAYLATEQHEQAWEVTEYLWEHHPNASLLMQRAQLQIKMVNIPSALEILKRGIEQGYETPQILINLAHYSLTQNREEAFDWVKRAVERFPDDPQLRLNAMHIGFNSGHSDWASMQMAILQRDYSDTGLFWQVKLPNLLEYMHEQQERSAENWNKFIKGHLPIHLWLDTERRILGAEFYWRWHHNRDKSVCKHVPFPLSYGGRSNEPLPRNWEGRNLTMDYSACLMAHLLKLFPSLESAFEDIYVTPSLFMVIQGEIQQLEQIQPDRIERAEMLLDRLESLPITMLSEPFLEAGDFGGLQHLDRVNWSLAGKNDLWIVDDQFATETFESGIIPEGLEALRLRHAEVLTVLCDQGELLLEESLLKQLTKHPVDPRKIEQLSIKTGLLVDQPFLELLIELDGLDAASKVFKLHCIEGIREQLNRDIESYRHRQKIKGWLQSLLIELKHLRLKNKIKLLPLYKKPSERHGGQPLTYELEEIFLGMEDKDWPVWIDDRLLTSYPSVSRQAPIVGVHDILGALHFRKKISDGKFIECFRNLYRAGVSCRLPSVSYLLKELAQVKFDPSSSKLLENSSLVILRQTISSLFRVDSILSKTPIRIGLIPEENEFRFQLHRLVDAAMIAVWTSDKFDMVRRAAIADWLYYQFLPQRGRTVSWEACIIDPIRGLATEQSFRMSLAWQFLAQPQTIRAYYRWLFAYIEPTWRNCPPLREAALSRFAGLIISLLNDFHKHEREAGHIEIFVSPLKFLPRDVLDRLLDHPKLESQLKKHFINVIPIDSLNLSFSVEEWRKLAEACIKLGSNRQLHITCEGRKIALEFKAGSGVGDAIIVSSQTINGTDARVSMLGPFERLEHPEQIHRIEWLEDMVSEELLDKELADHYRPMLSSDEFSTAATTLHQHCERCSNFFFTFAGLVLEISELPEHDWVWILPAYTEIFEFEPSIDFSNVSSMVEWLFGTCSDVNARKKHFATFAALPFGPPWELTTAIEQALSESRTSIDSLISIIGELAESSSNPITLQNLLAVCLQLSSPEALVIAEFLIKTLLTLEPNIKTDVEFDLYRKLLHLAWNHFQNAEEFKKCDYEQRIVWSYVYADRMMDSIGRKKSQNSNYLAIASKNLEVISAAMQARRNPFENDSDDTGDVTLPLAASWWRTVIGGTLSILERNTDALQNLQQAVLDLIQPLLEACFKLNHAKLRGLEFFEFADYQNNSKNSPISNQGWTIAKKLQTKLIHEQPLIKSLPIQFWLSIAKELDINSLGGSFMILARFPVPEELVESLINLLNVLIDEHTLNQKNKILFFGIAEVLGRLGDEEALKLRERLMDISIKALTNDSTLWSILVELVIKLNRNESHEQKIDAFVAMAKRIIEILPPETHEFSTFYAFLRNIEAYMPPNSWPELWAL